MQQLGMFAKYWEPGRVKTRLARRIGAAAAGDLYYWFVATQMRRLGQVADQRLVAFTPADRRIEFERLAANRWQLVEQSAGDLGQRMQSFFFHAFASGASQVVLIGSDSPTVPIEYITDAFRLLETCPVVLGPTPDGGYYLVGLRDELPAIFEGISWSSELVWQQTVQRLEQVNTPFARLEPWYDVDKLSDLKRLVAELRVLVERDPNWRELAEIVEPYAGHGK